MENNEQHYRWILLRLRDDEVIDSNVARVPRCPACGNKEFIQGGMIAVCHSPVHPMPLPLMNMFEVPKEEEPIGPQEGAPPKRRRGVGFRRSVGEPPADADAVPRRPDTGRVEE
jgi:hypothetical protein